MNKRLLISLFVTLIAAVAVAQTPAKLKFLGIPVDGNKTDIILQLKKKGFVYNAKGDYLRGVFNGMESNVRIHENYGKVDRVYIADVNTCSEAQIRIRFNNLLQQFKDNEKYIEIDENNPIPEKEDISYEMNVHNKNYDAVFYLDPAYEFTEKDKEKFYDNVRERNDG